MQQLPLGVRLRDRAVFDSFHPAGNEALLQHLQQAASRAGTTWIYGPRGAGKTHLLQAVCARHAQHSVTAYLPLRELAPLGTDALGGWPHAASLCLDDVDLVIGRREWELALFALFRDAEERGAALLVAASAAPRALAFALPDLASRFAASTVFAVHALEEVEQREALRLRARLRGLELPEETALYLQRRLPRDMETLYGLLDALDAAALQAQRRLTVPFIRGVLAQRQA